MDYKKILFLIIILFLNTVYISNAQDRLSGRAFATRSEVIARHGMVCTNHPLATQIGIDILKKGGSAVDAAIAANVFLGFADPAMNGIGGDLFAIVWDAKTEKLYGINGSGRSPQNLSLETLRAEAEKGNYHWTGPLSITTPGCVDAWAELHGKFGKIDFAQLLQPTIEYAREGVPLTSETTDIFTALEPVMEARKNEYFKKLYFLGDHMPRKGEIFKNPELANTLETIAQKGRDGFYKGRVAENLIASLQEQGAYLSMEDLAGHKSEWVEPVSTNYRGYDVWELPPNCQGIAALQTLNILEGFDINNMRYGSPEHVHTFVEAKKLAYEDLSMYYGDPGFNDIPLEALLSKEYAKKRRDLINPNRAGEYHPGLESGDHTIYLTVADDEGNMISLIQSVSALFGSKIVADGLGFVMQNRGGGFILKEDHVNSYAPGKRPFHTIIPAFVTRDGAPFMSFGLMGGDMQPQGHTQIIINIIDFGMNLQEAGDAPRIYHKGTRNSGHVKGAGDLYLEYGFHPETLSQLMDKGHNLRMDKGVFGGYQAIMVKDGVYYGASESRKDGQAAGY